MILNNIYAGIRAFGRSALTEKVAEDTGGDFRVPRDLFEGVRDLSMKIAADRANEEIIDSGLEALDELEE